MSSTPTQHAQLKSDSEQPAPETFVGCCGWSEAQSRYMMDFPTIELQSTFYQPPALSVARRWKAQAPPDFRFCMKAWQLITHTPSSPTYRRLKSPVSEQEHELYGSFRDTEQVWLAWERTREIAAVLEALVIVFQCPKSFLPTRENLRNLAKFFRVVDRDAHQFAWEPRGDAWKADLVRSICAEHQLIHCVDPFTAEPLYGDGLYWRMHGRGSYRYKYTDEDLAELREMLAAHRHLEGPSYLMFNNMTSKIDALRFMGLGLARGGTME
jgi:uncharacterized protein YecE (DUF72 family)